MRSLEGSSGPCRCHVAPHHRNGEKHNEPGPIATFIGFGWTLMPNGDNLHRNVIFRDGEDKADQIVPVSAYGWRIRLQSCRVEFLTT
jgi:hypothetical protein